MTIARLHNIDIILSCPNEDDNFDGFETNFKHDLHNASLFGFQQDRRDDLITLTSP